MKTLKENRISKQLMTPKLQEVEKKKYEISVDGCDDGSKAVLELSDIEIGAIEMLVKEINKQSTYTCKPVMGVKECN